MNHDMIKALKVVGERVDSLYNASSFHQATSRLTWTKEVLNGDGVEQFTRIDFRVFTNQTHPNELGHKKLEDYKLGFEFQWDSERPDRACVRLGLYSVSGHEVIKTMWITYGAFLEHTVHELGNMLLNTATSSPQFVAHIKAYYDAAVLSDWIADVQSAFRDQRSFIESCL